MTKRIFKLRNVVAIAICLTGMTMFFSCGKENSDKQITDFRFTTPTAVGVINEGAKTIAVEVPKGTDVSALVPAIAISDKATVSPASGVAQNFTNPVTYTVTAEDGSTAEYVVTVTIETGGGDNNFHYTVPENLKVVYTTTAQGQTLLTKTIIKVGVECYASEIGYGDDGLWSDYRYYLKPNTPTAGRWTLYTRIVSSLGSTEWKKDSDRDNWWNWFNDLNFLSFMSSWASYTDCIITGVATLIGTDVIAGVLTNKYVDNTSVPGGTNIYWMDPITKLFLKWDCTTPDGQHAVHEVTSWSTSSVEFGEIDLP